MIRYNIYEWYVMEKKAKKAKISIYSSTCLKFGRKNTGCGFAGSNCSRLPEAQAPEDEILKMSLFLHKCTKSKEIKSMPELQMDTQGENCM